MSARTGHRAVHRGLLTLAAAVAAGSALLTATATAAGAAPTAVTELGRNRGHARTQAALDAAVAAGAPGIQGQTQEGPESWFGSSGAADVTTGRPLRPGDRFRAGSITKTFVATVLLQLEAERRLSLDDSVEHLLPGVVHGNGNDGARITLRQVLNHTSGVFGYTEDPGLRARMTGGAFLKHRYDTYTPRQLVEVAMAHPPLFRPGTDWSYSNTNYILAGMVVSRVTGHPYAEEIQRRILQPLGLRSTSLPGTSPFLPGPHGRAYSKLSSEDPGAPVRDVTTINPSIAGSAGEIISTTADLNRFYRAIVRGELLPARQLNEMLTTVPVGSDAPGFRYGLGIASQRLPCGVTVWGHDGGIFGSQSTAAVTRDGGHAASFNTNADWLRGAPSPLAAEFCPGTPATAALKGVPSPRVAF